MRYTEVNISELVGWLKVNNVKHILIPETPGKDEIGNLIFFIEVYEPRDETAIRIKWETV